MSFPVLNSFSFWSTFQFQNIPINPVSNSEGLGPGRYGIWSGELKRESPVREDQPRASGDLNPSMWRLDQGRLWDSGLAWNDAAGYHHVQQELYGLNLCLEMLRRCFQHLFLATECIRKLLQFTFEIWTIFLHYDCLLISSFALEN